MNRLFQTEGIVLKSMKFCESDKIITIFSRNYGKIRVIAKGIRKTKSKFGSSMENLTTVKMLAFKGKSLNIVSQVEIINSFFPQCKNLNRYGLAINCAEIIDKILVDEDPNESVYQLFKEVLMLLKNDQNPVLLVESFKWKLFNLLGYQPELNKCVYCSQLVLKRKNHFFDVQRGGIACYHCREAISYNYVIITNYSLRLLKRIMDADLFIIHNKRIVQSALNELIKITNQFMHYHFEIENRSKEFLKKVYYME